VTGDPYDHLHRVLERLDALLEDREQTREDVLDLSALSASTGLTGREIGTLLRGGKLRERPVEEFVPKRVNFLYEKLLEESGRRPADIVHEVADRLKATSVWARSLLQGSRLPNVPHLKALAEYFGVALEFFTDSPAAAFARELKPVVDRLENPDPLAALVEQFDIKGIHARTEGRSLTQSKKEQLAAIIKLVLDEEGQTR
jgi:transcriptional regulator with XRE-family HTH domain